MLLLWTLSAGQTAQPQVAANPSSSDAVPSGTLLHIRLRQTISSFGSKQDTPISAIVIQPVELDGHIVLPMDSELRGTIARMRRGGVGLSHETAQLDLRFDTLILPRSQPQPLAVLVAGRAHDFRETLSLSPTTGPSLTRPCAKMWSKIPATACGSNPCRNSVRSANKASRQKSAFRFEGMSMSCSVPIFEPA
jgi:hypothetical protein